MVHSFKQSAASTPSSPPPVWSSSAVSMQLTDEDYMLGLKSKLMGQVNIVRLGRKIINDRGSFTLTSGVLSQKPIPGSASVSMVNAGLEGFVRAAALEMERGIRINIVSPIFVKETMEVLKMDSSQGMSQPRWPSAIRPAWKVNTTARSWMSGISPDRMHGCGFESGAQRIYIRLE